MKKVSVLIIMMLVLFCTPVYADEVTPEETITATVSEASIEASVNQKEEINETGDKLDSEVKQESKDLEDSEESQATASSTRVDLEFLIAIPNDALAKGLNPIYKVASSYVDANGETVYVTGGSKAIELKENECTVQNYLDIDTDDAGRKQAVAVALEKIGNPYAYGKSGPDYFDCSGFLRYCMSTIGVSVPRSSYSICRMNNKIDRSNLQAGDILATPGHVGLYLGNGIFIHAQDRSNGVVTDYLDVYNAKSYRKFKYYINTLN